jgi:hypothetical protein
VIKHNYEETHSEVTTTNGSILGSNYACPIFHSQLLNLIDLAINFIFALTNRNNTKLLPMKTEGAKIQKLIPAGGHARPGIV